MSDISADPCDLRSLPEFANDPRVVSNLIDGSYKTRDDTHLWLSPFTFNKDHFIYISLTQPTTIAMIRIWVRKVLNANVLEDCMVDSVSELQQVAYTFVQRRSPYANLLRQRANIQGRNSKSTWRSRHGYRKPERRKLTMMPANLASGIL